MSMPISFITAIASGRTELGLVPALKTSKSSPTSARNNPSPIWLRAELPVHSTRIRFIRFLFSILNCPSSCARPFLRRDLHGVPWAGKRRRVAQIKRAEVVHFHPVIQRSRKHIDSLCHFGFPVAGHLCAEKLTGLRIAGYAHGETICAWIICLV